MQHGTFARLFGIALVAVATTTPVQGQTVTATAVDDWSSTLWQTARDGDSDRVTALLREYGNREGTPEAPALRSAASQFESNIGRREETRAARISEARAELETKLEEIGEDPHGFRISEAMILTMELIELHGGSLEAAALMGDPLIARTIAAADRAARAAEQAGKWLQASELFYRLHVLFDVDQRYKADVDRQAQRLSMIRLYTPEHYWKLRNDRRIQADEPELPRYNSLGDTYQEKLDGIDSWLVIKSVEVAAERHVDGSSGREQLLKGLDTLQTMATTDELDMAFPGLADRDARNVFLAALDAERATIKALDRKVNARDIRNVVNRSLQASRDTVKVPPEALLHEFGNGALSALDDYTSIIWPDEIRRFERNTRGEFIGVGIQIQHDELMRIKVVTPLEGTPAQRAGVHSDDIIAKVNGESTAGFTLDQAVEVITGPRDTKVQIVVERQEGEKTIEKEFVLTRSPIKLRSVKGWKRAGVGEDDWEWFVDRESGIGYVRLTQFTENTASDLTSAVDAMRADGLNGLVLDLRFNPGGLLDQAVDVVGRFVPTGVVVTTENADGNPTGVERARGLGELSDIPVAVLVNEGSASASEIVAGALQDYAKRGDIDAIVIGKRSFGKGSVQNAWPLPTRARSMLKVTTQYYRLPGGRLIHRRPGMTEWGVEPDLAVDMLPSQNEQAITLRRDADVLPLDENGQIVQSDEPMANPDDLLTQGIDVQLEAAVILLKSRATGEAHAKAAREQIGSGA